MKRQGFIVIIVLMIIFAILHSGETTNCYVCDSLLSETCESNPKASNVMDCGVKGICLKCNYEIGKHNPILRSCFKFGQTTSLYDDSNGVPDKFECTTCVTDFCNNANALSTGIVTLGCLALFWTIRNLV
ncbi:uncharacterized protein LOC126851079 [Cataglyphis hispanica]|uniref:uncharacterized protein LOC126851079 n=1 Tax=Cataglyphis hispanica TaxID=1086592 RepID=UPI00218066C0|nr:uncharacterized protein LOC126851079 [Cataglyphis hispanica]